VSEIAQDHSEQFIVEKSSSDDKLSTNNLQSIINQSQKDSVNPKVTKVTKIKWQDTKIASNKQIVINKKFIKKQQQTVNKNKKKLAKIKTPDSFRAVSLEHDKSISQVMMLTQDHKQSLNSQDQSSYLTSPYFDNVLNDKPSSKSSKAEEPPSKKADQMLSKAGKQSSKASKRSSKADKQLLKADQMLSKADKQSSKADQTLSKADKQSSKADQMLSKADQMLSKADQMLSTTDKPLLQDVSIATRRTINVVSSCDSKITLSGKSTSANHSVKLVMIYRIARNFRKLKFLENSFQ